MVIAGIAEGADSMVVDGFIVRHGNADANGAKTYIGQSILKNCGGGINLNGNANGGKIAILNCSFSGNSSAFNGGGLHNLSSSPTITNCTFSGNTANYGGGIQNLSSSPSITNCTLSGNAANEGGGGIENASSSPTITNCTFSGNAAAEGGGMYNSGNSAPKINNTIIYGNGHSNYYNVAGTPIVTNSLIPGSGGSGAGWAAIYGVDMGGNIDANPLAS